MENYTQENQTIAKPDDIVLDSGSDLSTEELLEIFSPEKLEKVIEKRVSAILDLEKDIAELHSKGPEFFEELSAVLAIKEAKLKQLHDWYDIQDSVLNGTATQKIIDSKLISINFLEVDVKQQVDILKGIREGK